MAEQEQKLKPCNVEKFLTDIRKARDIEDRIIYRLNDALRTTSMSGRKDLVGKGCLDLRAVGERFGGLRIFLQARPLDTKF